MMTIDDLDQADMEDATIPPTPEVDQLVRVVVVGSHHLRHPSQFHGTTLVSLTRKQQQILERHFMMSPNCLN